MAQGARQSSLFAAEDFTVAYESFAQANLQAYDFETIRNAMVDYISTNYPENFNDYINSSEFIALIEFNYCIRIFYSLYLLYLLPS